MGMEALGPRVVMHYRITKVFLVRRFTCQNARLGRVEAETAALADPAELVAGEEQAAMADRLRSSQLQSALPIMTEAVKTDVSGGKGGPGGGAGSGGAGGKGGPEGPLANFCKSVGVTVMADPKDRMAQGAQMATTARPDALMLAV